MKNLKLLRENIGCNQKEMAKLLGLTHQSYNHYENGKREPDNETLKMIADYFNVSIDYLLGRELAPLIVDKGIKIPILGSISAGVSIKSIKDILGYEEIPEELAMTGEFFFLKIAGDSMSPTLLENDLLLLKKTSEIENEQIAAVSISGENATIKRIKTEQDGIRLMPDNHAYSTSFYTNKEISELSITIIGKMVELRRKF